MAREVIVYDREGNAIRLIAPERYPAPARQHYQAPAPYYEEDYQVPVRRKRRKRASRPLTSMFLLFVVGWVPCAFGAPGATWLLWGVGFVFLMLKYMKEE